MKKLKNSLLAIILILGIAIIFCGNFSISSAYAASEESFIFENYSTIITVSDENEIFVKEKITVNYLVKMYGFTRYIPYGNTTIIRQSGGKTYETNYYVDFEGLRVTKGDYVDMYFSEDGYVVINFGVEYDEPKINGLYEYEFEYRYYIGNDLVKDFDEFYFNLIEPENMPTINNFSFEINLPHQFDINKVGTFYGRSGATESGDFGLNFVNENGTYKITGESTNKIPQYYGLTIRAEFEEGYFALVPQPNNSLYIIAAVLLGVIALVSVLLFWFIGNNPKPASPVEFYPPDGKTPSEIAYLFKGSVNNEALLMLIITWANKKYLEISEENKNLKITKLQDPNFEKLHEKTVWNSLFHKENQIVLTSAVSTKLAKEFMTAKKEVEVDAKIEVFKKSTIILKIVLGTLLFAGQLISILMFAINSINITGYFLFVSFALAFISISIMLCFAEKENFKYGILVLSAVLMIFINFWMALIYAAVVLVLQIISVKFKIEKIAYTLTILSAGIAVMVGTLLKVPQVIFPIYLIVISSAFLIIQNLLIFLTNKRTTENQKIYGRILGFKNFLLKAEKARIEKLAKEDPSYYFNILPYAYVLGVSDVYCNKFKGIVSEMPDWYRGEYSGVDIIFSMYILRSFNIYSRNLTYSAVRNRFGNGGPHSGGHFGGGFGGGGGFSGGGFGGGGARGR